MAAIRTLDRRPVRSLTYPALIIATQLLDALALILAWGRGVEANPLMAGAIAVVGLGGIVALKATVAVGIAAIAWRYDFQSRSWLPVICLIGSIGALSALMALHY
jgi:hypothetical protein